MLSCKILATNGYKTLSIYVLVPAVNDAGTSVKLWDYKHYMDYANYSTSFMTDAQWKVCTSFPK